MVENMRFPATGGNFVDKDGGNGIIWRILCGDFLPRNSLKCIQMLGKVKKSTRVDFLVYVVKCSSFDYIIRAVF